MSNVIARMFTVSALVIAAAPLFAGCAMAPVEPGDEEGTPAEAQEALTPCSDASCTSLMPFNTNCILDGVQKASAPLNLSTGGSAGTVALYYSPSCHAVWAYTTIRVSYSTAQVCASNPSLGNQCANYSGFPGTYTSPMQFLRVNDKGSANTFTTGPLASGGTSYFTRTF